MRIRHRLTAVLAVVVLSLSSFAPGAAAAQPVEPLCFTETGQCIDPIFRFYWEANGGLAIYGFPLNAAGPQQLDQRQYTVQYFERARFEYHPENDAPFNILLGQFGRTLYPVDPNSPLATAVQPLPNATYFALTGHNLGGRFRAYWEANGGLAQFGVPLSEEIRERLEDGREYTVQYFERARFELHPENQAPYDVLLGQFGRRILNSLNTVPPPFVISGQMGRAYAGNADIRARLGLPTGAETRTPGAVQAFERGYMIYRADNKTITVLGRDTEYGLTGAYRTFADTWTEGQPIGGGPAPTLGQFFPMRGFGKVWRENREVQALLGYALTADEQGFDLTVQPFVGGLAVDASGGSTYGYGAVGQYILYTNGRFERSYR